MEEHYYEHHIGLRKNKLCPFYLVFATSYSSHVCNWHENIEIIAVRSGCDIIKYGSCELLCSEGDIVVINSGILHSVYGDKDFRYTYLIIDESFCTDNGISTEKLFFTPKFRSKESGIIFDEAVKRYIDHLNAEEKTPLIISKLRNAVLSLLIDLYENHSEPSEKREIIESPSEKYVKKVMYYIEYRYNEQITLDDLETICGITKQHLSREFKRCTGQTVMTYLNTIRCKCAEMCLSDGMSVTEAACECGFESVSYFSRTYKRIMGTPPSTKIKNRIRKV